MNQKNNFSVDKIKTVDINLIRLETKWLKKANIKQVWRILVKVKYSKLFIKYIYKTI